MLFRSNFCSRLRDGLSFHRRSSSCSRPSASPSASRCSSRWSPAGCTDPRDSPGSRCGNKCYYLSGNLNLVVRQDTMQQPAQTSGYYAASPTSTSSNPGHPRTPDGTVDIELEVGKNRHTHTRLESVQYFRRCATTRSIQPSGSPRPSRRFSLPS